MTSLAQISPKSTCMTTMHTTRYTPRYTRPSLSYAWETDTPRPVVPYILTGDLHSGSLCQWNHFQSSNSRLGPFEQHEGIVASWCPSKKVLHAAVATASFLIRRSDAPQLNFDQQTKNLKCMSNQSALHRASSPAVCGCGPGWFRRLMRPARVRDMTNWRWQITGGHPGFGAMRGGGLVTLQGLTL